jgi:hypothetical protein
MSNLLLNHFFVNAVSVLVPRSFECTVFVPLQSNTYSCVLRNKLNRLVCNELSSLLLSVTLSSFSRLHWPLTRLSRLYNSTHSYMSSNCYFYKGCQGQARLKHLTLNLRFFLTCCIFIN